MTDLTDFHDRYGISPLETPSSTKTPDFVDLPVYIRALTALVAVTRARRFVYLPLAEPNHSPPPGQDRVKLEGCQAL